MVDCAMVIVIVSIPRSFYLKVMALALRLTFDYIDPPSWKRGNKEICSRR